MNYKPNGRREYEVDLEECADSAQVLDWIFQIRGKAWADARTISDFLNALHDILHPQQNLCSGGANKQIKPRDFLRKVIEG